jgi:hypothetical protein
MLFLILLFQLPHDINFTDDLLAMGAER